MIITVLDCGFGNLYSIASAINYIGFEVNITNKPSEIAKSDRIILPGVGAFGNGMKCLEDRNLIEPIKESIIDKGIPFLGICLGMQLVALESEETKGAKGLGIIQACIKKIKTKEKRLPHMGFNSVGRRGGINENKKDYYFVHSYFMELKQKVDIVWDVEYENKMIAAICHKNINAVQYHPEKSQTNGLELLNIFVKTGRIVND